MLVIVDNAATVSHESTAARAYELYIRSGLMPGRCDRNWLIAERQLTREAAAAERRAVTDAGNEMTSEGGQSTSPRGL
ncbi:MAG TPA: DUF2934 domain-containing protein [Phycisphaerales bacterium]|nr:DUF2934 domain-containing protein [Phycisphaerales bacterium]